MHGAGWSVGCVVTKLGPLVGQHSRVEDVLRAVTRPEARSRQTIVISAFDVFLGSRMCDGTFALLVVCIVGAGESPFNFAWQSHWGEDACLPACVCFGEPFIV